jgi:uncharacterized protein (TIGR02145 family)
MVYQAWRIYIFLPYIFYFNNFEKNPIAMKSKTNSEERAGLLWLRVSFIVSALLIAFMFSHCQKDDINMVPEGSDIKINTDLVPDLSVDCSPGKLPLLYQHKFFIRKKGAPYVEKVIITNPDFYCFDGNFILIIRNGFSKKTRVSSAEIWIDGNMVAGPSDFSRNVYLITKNITGLTDSSLLEVKIKGEPGSLIDLSIAGKIINIVPEFDPVGPFCLNSVPSVLPVESRNVPPVIGTWEPAVINTSEVGTKTYTFTPESNRCAKKVTIEVEILPPQVPAFKLIGPLFEGAQAPQLPSVSENGINGTWNPSTINTSVSGSYEYTFTPSSGECSVPAIMTIEVVNKSVISDPEGNVYKIVKIGTQWWMAENLRTTRYNNGDVIPTTTPATKDISPETAPAYQWPYGGDENNVSLYGRLYTWYAASDTRNACPVGWHLPTDAEWTVLTTFLINNGYGYGGSGSDIAKSLAASYGWESSSVIGSVGNDLVSNNLSGFSALPAGGRLSNGTFLYSGYYTSWWSSTLNSTDKAWYRGFHTTHINVGSSAAITKAAIAVRCIMN